MKTFKKPDGSLWAYDEAKNDLPYIDACIADGGVLLTDAEVDDIRNQPLPIEQIIASKQKALEAQIQARLDSFATSVNFDSLLHACMTGLQPVDTYRQSEGSEFIKLRYETWQKAAEIRDAFLAGDRPEPTWEEVESELPVYPIGA